MLTKIEKEKILKELSAAKWDVSQELEILKQRINKQDLPRIRIDHHEDGKHRFYIDYGESYIKGNKQFAFLRVKELKAIVFEEQQVRALWKLDEDHPRCYAIDDQILSAEPLSPTCEHCPESIPGFGACKPKVRLFVLPLIKGEMQPMVMSLSPTSIKPWREHQLRLKRSGLPPVAVITTFSLEDTVNDSFRWARVQVGIRGIVSKGNLFEAKKAQQSISRIKTRVILQDFAEPGDRVEKSA
ncbi:MAG: hypothetical protein HQ556_00260 [Candidatus Marinimicrobia bacterium]|nr:hypothetical protein [Candidatus Neomarinimicrobiota bacterium]